MRTASRREALAYLDSSALVKLALEEAETKALREAVRQWPRRTSSRLSTVEVLRTVRRRRPQAEPVARRVLTGLALVAITDRVLADAVEVPECELRALDAIHVATALQLAPTIAAFVSYDDRQLAAAAALGLPAVSPR